MMALVFGSAEANKILAKNKALEKSAKEADGYLKYKPREMSNKAFWEMINEVSDARSELLDAELHYDMVATGLPSKIDAVDISEYWGGLKRSERLALLERKS